MGKLNPRLGNNEKPMVSIYIRIHKYEPFLRKCLDSVYAQTYDNIEVLLFDSSATDDCWKIALEYADKFPGTMTLGRNRLDFDRERRKEKYGAKYNEKLNDNFRSAANGLYFLEVNPNDALSPEYVDQFVKARNKAYRDASVPLVSVFIFNYNYGQYLRQCFDSVFSQTYENIEVLFSDNDSTDNSWDIAVEYAAKHPEKMTIMRNRRNLGPQSNSSNCYRTAKGKYFVLLCSDDAFMPEFIEQCVRALENNKTAKFALAHRHVIDQNGNITPEPSFYNQSCIIKGSEQAAVYMMAAVNPSISQVMYNWRLATAHTLTRGLVERWLSYRILDFNLCFKSDLAYIKEPLVLHRMHQSSETSSIDNTLVQVLAQFIFLQQCAEIAATNGFDKAAARLPQAVDKLGLLCLRYCVIMLGENNEVVAHKYFHLAQALTPDVIKDKNYMRLEQYWQAEVQEKAEILKAMKDSQGLVTRSISYDPPEGSAPIELKKVCSYPSP
jgi:glycosyltransferase involved in cell wall biosynthesis